MIFVLPLNQWAAGIAFLVCSLLNLVNVVRTRQFWPAITVPSYLSRPLWALFILSGVSTLWSLNPGASLFNWVWVMGQEAGIFYLLLRYASTSRRSLFLMKGFVCLANPGYMDGK